MKTILIIYPKLFTCISKFERKVSNIISKVDNYCVVFEHDDNNLISGFFSKYKKNIKHIKNKEWNTNNITNAIIFDDGEEFKKEVLDIIDSRKPYRLIKIEITRVVNIKRDTQYSSKKSTSNYEYIGRGSLWGNPYSMYEKGDDRDEVIRKYKYDFDHGMFINKKKSDVYKLLGKRLGCFCKPANCHGDVLAEYLNNYDDGR